MMNAGVDAKDLYYYKKPNFDSNVKEPTCLFMSYFYKWNPQENYYYCVDNTGFKPNNIRSEGTYTRFASLDDKLDGFHYYLMYIKFGIGRATSDAAHEVREGHITREEGIALVKKYDGEFPENILNYFLKYCDMNQTEFHDIIDSWRSKHIWKKEGNSWKLKIKLSKKKINSYKYVIAIKIKDKTSLKINKVLEKLSLKYNVKFHYQKSNGPHITLTNSFTINKYANIKKVYNEMETNILSLLI